MRVFNGVDELRAAAGTRVGASEWITVEQGRVDLFADATDDHQWIHVDVERAKQGPFGGPIAHGFLTLSLVLLLARGRSPRVDGIRMAVNYGLNRVRFPAPVHVGKRVRAHVKNLSIEDVPGGVQVTNQVTVEIEGEDKPACVAETIGRYYT